MPLLLSPPRKQCSIRKQRHSAMNPTPSLRRRTRRVKIRPQSPPGPRQGQRRRLTRRPDAYSGFFPPSAGLASPAAGAFALVSFAFGSGANMPSGFGSSLAASGFFSAPFPSSALAAGFFFASDLPLSSPLVARLVARPGPEG